ISPNEDEDGGDEPQAFYVGGSETGGGGQQVLGPRRRDVPAADLLKRLSSPENLVHKIFQTTKESGAEVLEKTRVTDHPSTSKVKPFGGSGYR
ncbi:unnamed protein product, partial [Protopolystoma xenopodis]